mgnify:CR=1 FL=1
MHAACCRTHTSACSSKTEPSAPKLTTRQCRATSQSRAHSPSQGELGHEQAQYEDVEAVINARVRVVVEVAEDILGALVRGGHSWQRNHKGSSACTQGTAILLGTLCPEHSTPLTCQEGSAGAHKSTKRHTHRQMMEAAALLPCLVMICFRPRHGLAAEETQRPHGQPPGAGKMHRRGHLPTICQMTEMPFRKACRAAKTQVITQHLYV